MRDRHCCQASGCWVAPLVSTSLTRAAWRCVRVCDYLQAEPAFPATPSSTRLHRAGSMPMPCKVAGARSMGSRSAKCTRYQACPCCAAPGRVRTLHLVHIQHGCAHAALLQPQLSDRVPEEVDRHHCGAADLRGGMLTCQWARYNQRLQAMAASRDLCMQSWPSCHSSTYGVIGTMPQLVSSLLTDTQG